MRFRIPPTKPSSGMQATMAPTIERMVAVRIEPMRGASARVHLSLEDVEGLDEEPVSVDKGHGGEDFKRIPEAEASAREITLGQGRESRSGIADRSDEAEDRGSDGCERIDLDSLVQIGGRLFPRVVQIVLHGSDDIGFFESVILSAVFDLEVEAEDERQHAE